MQGLPWQNLLPTLEATASLQRMRGQQFMRARKGEERVQTMCRRCPANIVLHIPLKNDENNTLIPSQRENKSRQRGLHALCDDC